MFNNYFLDCHKYFCYAAPVMNSQRVALPISDDALLAQAQEILDLLIHANRLGWTLVLKPEEYQTIIAILTNAQIAKTYDNSKTKH